MYLLLLLVGWIGFLSMAILGFMHGGSHAHHAFGGHAATAGHAPSLGGHHLPGHMGHVGHAGHTGSASHAPAHQSHAPSDASGRSRSFPAWLMISPMDLFSFSLGAGATGTLLHTVVSAALLPWAAVIGALAFNLGVAKPMMGFMMKFVSKPSEGLEGMVAKTATAVTRFDKDGRGLIMITLDDQNVQLLATLEDADIHHGVQVNKGDEVVVVEIDSTKNTCRVSKEL